MSELSVSLIPLEKGLNLQVPKLVAEPGTVLDSLNYEQVDFQGQKRIDGYIRYDGQTGSDIEDYYVLLMDDVPSDFNIGDLLYVNGELFGVLLDANIVPEDYIVFALIDLNKAPRAGDVVTNEDGVEIAAAENTVLGRDFHTDPDVFYNNLLTYNNILRLRAGGLPGPVAGLHWFRDRLYAVAGMLSLKLSITNNAMPNDLIYGNDGFLVRVVAAKTVGSSQIVTVLGGNTLSLTLLGQSIYRQNGDLLGVVEEEYPQDTATFYEAVDDHNAEEESKDAGWNPIHLGWSVPFDEGISLYGSLPSLNQNIQGLGIQGPTSTTGNNGRPLRLTQKVSISNAQAQVNGWKNSNTPTTYELFPNNVAQVDTLNVFADAFISWSGDSNVVTAPGITSGALIEYPANGTVPVTI